MKTKAWMLLFLLLGACGEPPKNYVLQVKWQKLTEADIYNQNMVYDVVFDAEEQQIDSLRLLSRQLFLQGAEALKNKNQPNEATRLLKESILVLPDAKSYNPAVIKQFNNTHSVMDDILNFFRAGLASCITESSGRMRHAFPCNSFNFYTFC